VLELPTPDAVAAAARMLPTATADPDALSLRVAGSTDATIRDTLVRLDDARVSVANLRIVTPDLDDVFFALTGAPVTEHDAAEENHE
jgi:ABC-2 type transport system ATP-binding protein